MIDGSDEFQTKWAGHEVGDDLNLTPLLGVEESGQLDYITGVTEERSISTSVWVRRTVSMVGR